MKKRDDAKFVSEKAKGYFEQGFLDLEEQRKG